MTDCQCPPGRPLGADHTAPCEQAKVVSIYRNPDTGRPVAVPDEVVSEAEREYRAYKLHKNGTSWAEIAIMEGWPDGRAASQAVKRYLDEGKAIVGDLSRKEMLAMEISYLMDYRAALREAAMEGKVSAIMASLGIHDRMMKAFGLDQPEAEAGELDGRTVVVVQSDFIAPLKQVSGGDAPPAG